MTKREVLQINTPEGDAVLRARARKIARMDEQTRAIVRDMIETMPADGVGLAAPQIGESIRVILITIAPGYLGEDDPGFQMAMYNPQIIRRRGGKEIEEEGCLSLRYWYGPVERDAEVVVRAYDMQDREVRITAAGFLARVLQHEIDHLEGVMFTDHMENPGRDLRYAPPRDPDAPEDDGETAEQKQEQEQEQASATVAE